ncbi:MAG TPA: argininosuccinate lyase [Candidatus Hydrogenedentes bacterium]|nr:argininosuccinate lyase [Candidatus Hydrogenedentota bacterium]HRT19294.1 argininosuccinate lyase [Candidatus Hydrogenedentota bacterium]HRT63374.1 argininosuccinate lyase [Candidatus Hydrogenedentota bacterium]
MTKLWGGRFEKKTDEIVERLGESVSYDARLAPWDIRASIAHARMLGDTGIISRQDAHRIVRGLESIAKDVAAGRFTWDITLEDIHTNIEAELVRRIGDPGKRLHTARSRNDQIATDVRLWMRDQIDAVRGLLINLQSALIAFAEKHAGVILPGFTHMQHAQPVLLAHHVLAYHEMFDRDRERFGQLRARVNVLPLGSAALAGTPHPIRREQVARELGFAAVSANSMDAVSDRDHLIEFCAAASIAMMHLSRLCEELVVWSSQEFGFIEIGDAFTTGSSIMPQKKNPDVAELVRGKTGRVYGSLIALLALMKGLPLAYNRDLQEDKEPLFDASDTLQLCLAAVARMIPAIRVNAARMAEAAREGFMEATDLADALVNAGMPFRDAHAVVGRIVLHCVRNGKRLTDLSLSEIQTFSPLFNEKIRYALDMHAIVKKRDLPGGTAPRRVMAALRRAKARLAGEQPTENVLHLPRRKKG